MAIAVKKRVGFIVVSSSTFLILAACSGVANDIVIKEANAINKSTVTAQALHARCLDAGPDADPTVVATLCADELRALSDIQSHAAVLLDAAGAGSSSTGGEQ